MTIFSVFRHFACFHDSGKSCQPPHGGPAVGPSQVPFRGPAGVVGWRPVACAHTPRVLETRKNVFLALFTLFSVFISCVCILHTCVHAKCTQHAPGPGPLSGVRCGRVLPVSAGSVSQPPDGTPELTKMVILCKIAKMCIFAILQNTAIGGPGGLCCSSTTLSPGLYSWWCLAARSVISPICGFWTFWSPECHFGHF